MGCRSGLTYQAGFFCSEPRGVSLPAIQAGGSLAGKESWEASSTGSTGGGDGRVRLASAGAGVFFRAGLVTVGIFYAIQAPER